MQSYTFTPQHVCPRQIHFELDDGKLYNVRFDGGCDGNTKAIGKLLEGTDAAHAAQLLLGNQCKNRGTSCADQLAQAVLGALQEAG